MANRKWIRLTVAETNERLLVNTDTVAVFERTSAGTQISWVGGHSPSFVSESIEDIGRVICQEIWEDIPL